MDKRAIDALLNYEQADEEGILVKTSRQAIHEVVDYLTELEQENERLKKYQQQEMRCRYGKNR